MIDINTALGMVERPLQVGDWVECVDTGGYSWLENASWPKRIVLVGDDDGWVSFEESDEIGEWNPCRFRRVDPPRDEVAELREQVRILNEICDDIRGTFGYSRDDMVDLTTYVAQDYAELKQQLATVTRERDEALKAHKAVASHYGRVVKERDEEAIRGDRAEEELESQTQILSHVTKEREKLREQLSTVQAEVTAMFRLVEKYAMELREEHDPEHFQTESQRSISHKLDLVRKVLDGTAGRELLDELKAKDERIRELQADAKANKQNTLATAELLHHMAKDIERKRKKCYTAKLSTLRGKIDPAWFGESACRIYWKTNSDKRAVWYSDGQGIFNCDKGTMCDNYSKTGRPYTVTDMDNIFGIVRCDEFGNKIGGE